MIMSTTTLVRVGFSPCPNDTFMFHGLVTGQVPIDGVSLVPEIEDIEALNERAVQGSDPLPLSKLSVTALGRVSDRYAALCTGAALGRGCGPLVVRHRKGDIESLADLAGKRVAIPGQYTTAHMLLRIFAPRDIETVPMRFDEIMRAVNKRQVDAGVIIHEGRFTFGSHKLEQVADLGEVWEGTTGLPIPLGLICVSRETPPERADRLERGLRESIELAFREPARSRSFIKRHAQEMDEDVCRRHIELYVNDFSVDMGDEGRAAIDELFARGRAAGMIPNDAPPPWR